MEKLPERWREASAARYVGERSPPTLIIAGGEPRFTAGEDEVLASLSRYGIRRNYYAFDGAPHGFWLFEPYMSRVVDMIDTFLQSGD